MTKIGQLARPRAPTADAHAMQAEPPAVAPCLPIGQVVQVPALVAPPGPNVPAAQSEPAQLVAPLVEVHLSDPRTRPEEFRHHSVVTAHAVEVVAGHGVEGYRMALDVLATHAAT